MSCSRCSSPNQSDYSAEITFHLPGTKDLEKPPVLVFPSIRVCLSCGLSEFELDKEDLQLLIAGADTSDRAK